MARVIDDARQNQDTTGDDLYRRDVYAWSLQQATLLRDGRLAEVDVENLAEEIESMGASQRRELHSRLRVLAAHLLKETLDYSCEPHFDPQGWRCKASRRRAMAIPWSSRATPQRPLVGETSAGTGLCALRAALLVAHWQGANHAPRRLARERAKDTVAAAGIVQRFLQWIHQPEQRCSGWRGTIRTQRYEIALLFAQSPSLRRLAPGALAQGYPSARALAADETGLAVDTFPPTCPFTLEEALDEDYWPG